MKKAILLSGCMVGMLMGYADADLDGVEDRTDRCPNTSMTELVDAEGCPVESLVRQKRMDVITGLGYSDASAQNVIGEGEDTVSLSLQFDYYARDFSFQVATAFYDADGSSGTDDTLVAAYYMLRPSERLLVRLGGGIVLPTYDTGLNNEAADYMGALNASYTLTERLNVFGGVGYTVVNDDDVYAVPGRGDIRYQNTTALHAGVGYNVTPKLYASLSYYRADSIYRDVGEIRSVGAYGFYTISGELFATFSYAAGLSDAASDNAFSVRLGRYF